MLTNVDSKDNEEYEPITAQVVAKGGKCGGINTGATAKESAMEEHCLNGWEVCLFQWRSYSEGNRLIE